MRRVSCSVALDCPVYGAGGISGLSSLTFGYSMGKGSSPWEREQEQDRPAGLHGWLGGL